jgi:hypothetical protein
MDDNPQCRVPWGRGVEPNAVNLRKIWLVHTVTQAKVGRPEDLKTPDSGFLRNDVQGFHITGRELKLTALGPTRLLAS